MPMSRWHFSQIPQPSQGEGTTGDYAEFDPLNLRKPPVIRLPLIKHRVEFYWSNLREGFVASQLENPG